MPHEHLPQPFDENAALEALERLQEEILQARARREQKSEEFEAWVRKARTESRAQRVAAIEQEAADFGTASAASAANRATDPASQWSAATAAPAAKVLPDWSPFEDERPLQQSRPRSTWRLAGRRAHYAAGAAGVIIGAVAFVLSWNGGAPRPAEELPAASPTGPAAQARTVARRPLEIELTTVRPVWMRVVVDGEREVEREIPAGRRLTFGADRTIVVRVGDGGGVRLAVNGQDQGQLGRDGQITVRTLTPR